MMDPILQSLREVTGVQGAMVVDHGAAVIAHHAHATYDIALLQQVARSVVNLVDAVRLIEEDWEVLTAHFADGKLVLRSLPSSGAKQRRHVLAVIADSTLNIAFLGVALRVASTKLAAALEAGAVPVAVSVTGSAAAAAAAQLSGPVPRVEPSIPLPVRSAVSGAVPRSGSSVGNSLVEAGDTAGAAFLSACTHALATSLGPIAKVFVRDAVRKVCGDRSFSRVDGPALLEHLAGTIDNAKDRAAFQAATRRL